MKKHPATLVALASLAIGMAAVADVDVRPIALKGDAAPGTGSGVFTSFIGTLPVINDDGDVAFISTATGGDEGIWFENAGTLSNIALEGDTAPGTGGFDEFTKFEDLIITRSNTAAFSALTKKISSGVPSWDGYWVDQSGTTSLIIRDGQPATYIASDATLTSLKFLSYSKGGVAAIQASCDRPGPTDPQGNAILTAASGSISKFALNGEFIPGSGDKWSGLDGPVHISTGGSLLFEFNNDDPMIPPPDIDVQIYFANPTAARQRAAAPGGGPGDGYGNFYEASIVGSPAGFAFAGSMLDYSIPVGAVEFDTALWRYAGAGGEVVASEGMSAPGLPGEDFGSFFSGDVQRSVHMNADGDVAFRHATDAGTFGIWTAPAGGSLAAVALEGQSAPGISGYEFASFGLPMIVADGQIAFSAFVVDGLGGTATAIFATNSTGTLELVVSTLDTIDINDDCDNPDVQTIKTITLDDGRGTQQGQSNAFNDDGELVLNIEYGSSGEGIFVFDTRACRADFNGDGTLDFNDFTAFQNAFQAEECEADWDGDGDFTIFDFNGFNAAYDAGCEWY